jgi:hypothetical protein
MREKRNSAPRRAAGSGRPLTQAPTFAGIALALGGEVHGREVLAPGPGHSAKDRSLSVTLSPTRRTACSFIPLQATICADAAITSANGLGCRYFVQSGRRNRPPAPITAHLANRVASQPKQPRSPWITPARPPGYGAPVSRSPKVARRGSISARIAAIAARSHRRSAISPRTACIRRP